MIRPRFLVISFLSVLFTAAICVLVFWVLAKGEDTARDASTQFATALVQNDPSLAPEGGADHLEELHRRFGDISGARVVKTRNHRVGKGDDARTYYVSELRLETARGPAVIELQFDSGLLFSETVSGVRQLAPKEVAEAPAARAERPARVVAEAPAVRKAKQRLRCVQRAQGDVEKLARCAG
jgi:hypothetical protein